MAAVTAAAARDAGAPVPRGGDAQCCGRRRRTVLGCAHRRVRAELDAVHAELAALHPDIDGRMSGVTVKPVREALNFAWDVLQASFTILLGAAGFVLLIACVNVASLTLARTW